MLYSKRYFTHILLARTNHVGTPNFKWAGKNNSLYTEMKNKTINGQHQ